MYGGEGGEECGGKVGEMKVENGKMKVESGKWKNENGK